ncbi:hypothetical protein HGRIS_008345 [Hohenbuehelia grisea]|uniref:Copper transporter n=1 Tax=Hohenbuehelia grisea TaxID=104357 RepID=A0ABR3J817_9AGAR
MTARQAYLHTKFLGEHILFADIELDSWASFWLASALVAAICLLERLLTFSTDVNWAPSSFRRTRWRHASWKAIMTWFTTFLRLLYMLVAMTFHVGLILVIATTLALAQFFMELYRPGSSSPILGKDYHYTSMNEPLLDNSSNGDSPYLRGPISRPRQKSRPSNIRIHKSNVARADAVALELGIASGSSSDAEQPNNAWVARPGHGAAPHRRQDSQRYGLHTDDGEQHDRGRA